MEVRGSYVTWGINAYPALRRIGGKKWRIGVKGPSSLKQEHAVCLFLHSAVSYSLLRLKYSTLPISDSPPNASRLTNR